MKRRIRLVSLIDVIFLLLIFFLLNSFISIKPNPRLTSINIRTPEEEGDAPCNLFVQMYIANRDEILTGDRTVEQEVRCLIFSSSTDPQQEDANIRRILRLKLRFKNAGFGRSDIIDQCRARGITDCSLRQLANEIRMRNPGRLTKFILRVEPEIEYGYVLEAISISKKSKITDYGVLVGEIPFNSRTGEGLFTKLAVAPREPYVEQADFVEHNHSEYGCNCPIRQN